MSINDSSALILIIGALAVLGFVIHGLWFSGRSVNRKLSKENKQDQEIIKSHGIGKVRIINNPAGSSDGKGLTVENYDSRNGAQSVNEVQPDDKTPGQDGQDGDIQEQQNEQKVYQLFLVAAPGQPYLGEDIEEVCKVSGFLRKGGLFFVYEDVEKRDKVVFKICSLEKPYYFPENMRGYETREMGVFMTLPEHGKAERYFTLMRLAAQIFVDKLGGAINDENFVPMSQAALDQMQSEFRRYDEQI